MQSMELNQFCILSRSLKGRAAAALVSQVINHKKIFVFGELLAEPSLQALRGTENEVALATLELFAYGNFAQYHASPSHFLPLTPYALHKLRLLSLLSLISTATILPYSTLLQNLYVESIVDLETLLIDAIELGLLVGQLDQLNQCLHITSCCSRDVRPGDISVILAQLSSWRDMCVTAMTNLETSSKNLLSARADASVQQLQLTAAINKEASQLKNQNLSALSSVLFNRGPSIVLDIDEDKHSRNTARHKRSRATTSRDASIGVMRM